MKANTIHRRLRRISWLPNGVVHGLIAGLLLGVQILPAASAETNTAPSRVTVAVIPWRPLEPPPVAPEERHWISIFTGLVTSELRQIAALNVVPQGAVMRELARQCREEQGNTNAAIGIRTLGDKLRAQWVIDGGLKRGKTSWEVQVFVENAAMGELSEKFSATSTNWFELRDRVVGHVLQRMDITPSPEEQRRLGRRWTTSPQALEWLSQGDALAEQEFEQRAELCRKALAEDPQFVQARALYAVTLYNLGREDEALTEARRALSQNPDAHLAGQLHNLVAAVLVVQKQSEEAAQAVAEGLKIAPESIELLEMRASFYEHRGDLQSAGDCLRRAVDSDPNNPALYAGLGALLSRQGDLTNALANLDHAAQLAADTSDEDQLHLDQTLAEAYLTLGNRTNALRHYRRLLAMVHDSGLPASRVVWVEETVREIERRSQPLSVAAGRPRDYSAPELQAALRERLSPVELMLAVNPIASTPEMAGWAGKIVAGTQGDLARARKLFDELASRPNANTHTTRTAQEVFAAWTNLTQSFCCQEYAKLFVALARSVGLPAFYVHVDRDYSGTIVDHDCAVVFAEGKAWLVDPAYAWFGVPHRDFRVLDDLQTIAHHAFQPHDGKLEVSLCRAGVKLDRDFVWGRMNLVMALINSDQLDDARKELEIARKQDPEFWRGDQLAGLLAFKQDRMDEALNWLQRAEQANPTDGDTRLVLAQVLFRGGQHRAAREEFVAGLRRVHTSVMEKDARETLALLDEALGAPANTPGATQSKTDARSYGDLAVSFLSGSKPDYAEAAKWIRKAAEMGDPQAKKLLGLLYWTGRGVPKDVNEAVNWFREAAEAGDAEAMRNLAIAYDTGVGVKKSAAEATRWLRRAAEAGDAQSQMLIGRAHYEGIGIPKDLTEALFWLMLATEPRTKATGVIVGNASKAGDALALRKEVELFASPEELGKAKAKYEILKSKQPPARAEEKSTHP